MGIFTWQFYHNIPLKLSCFYCYYLSMFMVVILNCLHWSDLFCAFDFDTNFKRFRKVICSSFRSFIFFIFLSRSLLWSLFGFLSSINSATVWYPTDSANKKNVHSSLRTQKWTDLFIFCNDEYLEIWGKFHYFIWDNMETSIAKTNILWFLNNS